MRGTVAKRLRDKTRRECPYPSSHELVHVRTRWIEIAPGRSVALDDYQIRCVGWRRAYLDAKRAYKALNRHERRRANEEL